MMTATLNNDALLDRSAIRFLISHRCGRLVTGDPLTGRTWAAAVDYRFGDDGSLVVELPDDDEQGQAIRQGAPSALTVMSDPTRSVGPVVDEDGLPTPNAIAHLSAHVDADVEAQRPQSLSVRLYVRDVEVYLRREALPA